jgi:hypothetical protein
MHHYFGNGTSNDHPYLRVGRHNFRLASILIACNLRCNLRRENQVFAAHLLGRFHLDHLYKGPCNSFYNPMYDKLIYEWNMDVTTLSMQIFSFTLYLPYASLHHTLLDFHMYLILQVTYVRWCILDPLRSPCLTSLGHPLDMGSPAWSITWDCTSASTTAFAGQTRAIAGHPK